MEAEKEMWDELNIEYEKAYENNPFKKACVAHAVTLLKPGSRVLDVGCGTGVPVAQMLAEAGMDVVGTDVAPNMIKLAQSRVKGTFIVADTTTYQPEQTFAAIFIIYSQLGLTYSAFHEAATRLVQYLEPGGLLVIGQSPTDGWVPDDAPEWNETKSYVSGYNLPFMGEDFATLMFSRKGMGDYLRTFGLEVVYDTVDVFQPEYAKSDPETQQYIIGQRPRS